MAAVTLQVSDLEPFAPDIDPIKAQAMIDDAMALAARVAPCITTAEFTHEAAAKAILRGAVLRWNDSGTGAVTQQAAGPFSQTLDTRQTRRSMFWPSEISELQKLCREGSASAFTIDTVGLGSVHADVCSINFGANYCSCGADIAGFPLWES